MPRVEELFADLERSVGLAVPRMLRGPLKVGLDDVEPLVSQGLQLRGKRRSRGIPVRGTLTEQLALLLDPALNPAAIRLVRHRFFVPPRPEALQCTTASRRHCCSAKSASLEYAAAILPDCDRRGPPNERTTPDQEI